MNYRETFIQVAPDCPAKTAVIPTARGAKKTIAVLEYELLSGQPYFYTQEELQFAVHHQHKGTPAGELRARCEMLWTEFFSKPRACLRASALPKKYGWGLHFDAEGRIALYAVESAEYRRLAQNSKLKQLLAMRSQRA